MSETCVAFCPNYNDCVDRLSTALHEGAILDKQEARWGESMETLPGRKADLVLRVVALEVESTDDTVLLDAVAEDASIVAPSAKLRNLENARSDLDRAERDDGIIAAVLMDLKIRQQQNSQEVVRLSEISDQVGAAMLGCSGPGITMAGKLAMTRDKLRGYPADPVMYVANHAQCSSKAVTALTKDMPVVTQQYVPMSKHKR